MKNLILTGIPAKLSSFRNHKLLAAPNIGFPTQALFFLLLCTFSLSAQEANKGWGLEAYYTPQYSNYLSSDFLKNDNLVPAYSYSIGLGYEKDIAKSWAINAGLVFQNTREKEEEVLSDMGNLIGDQIGNFAVAPGGSPGRRIEYLTLAIPITTKLFIQKGILRWYCRTGPQLNLQYQARSIFIANSDPSRPFGPSKEKVITNLIDVSLSWVLALGMDVNLGNVLSVFVEPEGKANLFRAEGVFDTRKYLAGLRVGMKLRFWKEL